MKLLYFLTFGFFSKCTFLRLWHFISPSFYPINSIFSVAVCIYKTHVSDQAFSLLAIVAVITEKMYISYFHGNLCKRKIPSWNHVAYQSRLSLEKMEPDKSTEEKSLQRCVLQPITKVKDHSNIFKMDQ